MRGNYSNEVTRTDHGDDDDDGDDEEESILPLPSSTVDHEMIPLKPVQEDVLNDPMPETPKFSYSRMLSNFTSEHNDENTDTRPKPFDVLEGSPPFDHHWSQRMIGDQGTRWLRRIQKEHKILRSSLPDGVFVRTWDNALDVLRVLILGPLDTPYEYAPFIIDLYLGSSFPSEPPEVFFHSWTDGSGPINPNLYEDGKICLSLLNTWPGDDKNQSWSMNSTLLQVLVSLLGLVFVKEPYYSQSQLSGPMILSIIC